jgi:N-acetylglucosaminyldiphosphoundecaprenol N-acetyl-beta-D-mannosaminyltransferase
MKKDLPSIKILGTDITTASEREVLEYIFKRLENSSEKFYIVTPNPEILMLAARSQAFRDILNRATISLPDGIGVLMAGRILKKQIIGRITGTDLMEKICAEASKRPITIGFLGGSSGIAEKSSECLREKYPGLRVIFTGKEWDGTFKEHIDILFVAFGAPKQEEWIFENLPKINVTAAMGVGGAFDFWSGKVKRAPALLRRLGMEWAFRLVYQPWRAKRQLALPRFAYAVLKERFS